MINKKSLHLIDLEPYEPEGVDIKLSVHDYLLYTKIEGEVTAVLTKAYLIEASNFYSKMDLDLPLTLLDEQSFDKLYNRFLELRTEKDIAFMKEQDQVQNETEDEENLSLTEFLRTSSDILTSEESAPIIKFVNALFYQALKQKASDIHIQVHEKGGKVRFRVDGILTKNADLDEKVINLIVSRIKVISNMDISEQRIPQDGRTQVKIAGKTLDVRVSVLPTFYGERVVMRLLMQSDQVPLITELGFAESLTSQMQKLVNNPHGIILVTGPTGSGKTTSLYSFLKEVESPDINLMTVEDPVEYKSESISQIQVNEKVGLSFASALRSILRQDPDIIMIGEIRDEETANIAIRAALTGHLVFSTLHTNSAVATIARLKDMGIEPFLISSSLLGILSQRLVRKLCPACKEEDSVAENFAKDYKLPQGHVIFKAAGCPACNFTGYKGRQSVGELLVMDDTIQGILKQTHDEHEIKEHLSQKGFITIDDQLKTLLLKGETSLDEAVRIGLRHA